MNAVTVNDDGLVLRLYIQPKASRDSIVGLHGDEVKVAITAPPVDGQANSHLVKFLGKQFRVAKSQVVIEKGELGRHKQIKIINPQQIPPEIAACGKSDRFTGNCRRLWSGGRCAWRRAGHLLRALFR